MIDGVGGSKVVAEQTLKRSAHDLEALLRVKYGAPEWLFLAQTRFGTGRRADGLALNLWASRGMEFHGFEIKISRSDWLREHKLPQKADELAKYVDHWWLVVSDLDVVHEDEIPTGWGLMIPRGGGLGIIREASRLDPVPLDRFSAVMIIRDALERVPSDEAISAAEDRGYKRGVKHGKEEEAQRWDASTLERLRQRVDEFRKASGIDIEGMYTDPKNIGEAVKFVVNGGLDRQIELIDGAFWQVLRAAKEIWPVIESYVPSKDRYSSRPNQEKEFAEVLTGLSTITKDKTPQ
jgi:hypothetical protein